MSNCKSEGVLDSHVVIYTNEVEKPKISKSEEEKVNRDIVLETGLPRSSILLS